MGDDDDGVAFGMQLTEDRHHFLAGFRVECAGRFIGQDHLATIHQRARDRYALLLAAGQLGRLVVHAVTQAQPLQQLLGTRVAHRAGAAGVYRWHFHVAARIQIAQQVVALEDETEMLAAQPRQRIRRHLLGGLAVHPVAALGRPVEAAENVHQRRFSRSRRADDGDELTGIDAQRDQAGRLGVGAAGRLADHHVFALAQAGQDLHGGGGAQAGGHCTFAHAPLGINHLHGGALAPCVVRLGQRRQRHLQRIGHPRQLQGHLHRHRWLQRQARVGHIEQAGVVHRLRRLCSAARTAGGRLGNRGRRGFKLLQVGFIAASARPQCREPQRLPWRHQFHIGLGDLGAHRLRVHLRQHHDGRRGLHRIQRLPGLGDNRHDVPISGRNDAGVAQVDPRGFHLGQRLVDLCLQRGHVGTGSIAGHPCDCRSNTRLACT
ncbi:hypothetical protein G6F31_013646 [Rhizopus arrhizus]|nr:hypothetical protein G6F31_013646 [Rhizopus arrhizus]